MRQRARFVIGFAAAAALTVGLTSGCMSAPDRQVEADRLQNEISRMSGVDSARVSYSNDLSHGSTLRLSVSMTGASENLIAANVRRIVDLIGHDFDKYRRSAEFTVAELTTLECGEELDADQIAADAQRLRQLRELVPDGKLDWFRGSDSSRAHLFDVQSSDAAISGARTALGDLPVTAFIRPARSDERMWDITFPFTIEQEQRVRQQLTVPGLSISPIVVSGDHISELKAAVTDRTTAATTLEQLITAIHPTPQHPLSLEFTLAADTTRNQPRFEGSVDAGTCSYNTDAPAEKNPEKYYTPDAIAIQQQLRAEFDTCDK